MTDQSDEPIGSLGQEAAKLLRAVAAERLSGSQDADGQPTHVCSTGWCPVCQVVRYVQDHPEFVDQVTETLTETAAQATRALREFLDALGAEGQEPQ